MVCHMRLRCSGGLPDAQQPRCEPVYTATVRTAHTSDAIQAVRPSASSLSEAPASEKNARLTPGMAELRTW